MQCEVTILDYDALYNNDHHNNHNPNPPLSVHDVPASKSSPSLYSLQRNPSVVKDASRSDD